jgi:hypothetical protein
MAVELYIEDELIDLIGDEKIQTDYAIAEIGNFQNRNSFRSVDFDVPRTANNKRILDNSDIVNNTTVKPYRRLKARVFVDGIDQLIRFADIESVEDNFNLRLYGGNASFFDLTKSKKITQTDLSDLEHTFDLTTVIASRTNSFSYIYLLIDFHADSPNNIISNPSKVFDIRYTLPAISINKLLNSICIDNGYGLVNNLFLSDVQYLTAEHEIQIITNEYEEAINVRFNLDAESNIVTTPTTITAGVLTIDAVFVDYNIINSDSDNRITNETLSFQISGGTTNTPTLNVYNVAATGTYNAVVSANVRYTGTTTFNVTIGTVVGSVFTVRKNIQISPPTVGVATNFQLELIDTFEATQDDKVVVMIYVASSSGGFIQLNNSNISIIPNSLIIQFGEYMYIQYLLPNLKQSEFIKAYLQQYCAIIQVNEFTKIVRINKFDDIISNISNAYDWSGKIDYSEEPNINYAFDKMAQQNTLTYSNDDTVKKPTGTDGNLFIDDETLESTNEYIELPYAASNLVTRLQGVLVPQIKLFTTDDGSPPITELTEDVEPRVLLHQKISGDVDYTDGTTTTTVTTNLPIAWFIRGDKTYNLGFSNNLIPSYYKGFENALNKTKIVTERIKLNNLDIETLDFLRPVFLDKHNAYFYISKISGFDYGSSESTEVELVKIR